MLLTVKCVEIFSTHNGCGFIYGFMGFFFALNWYIFVVLGNEKPLLPL